MKVIKKILYIVVIFLINTSIVNAATDLTIMPIYTSDWGDATLLESSGEYLLIDVSYGDSTQVLDFLINKKVKKFDLYLSHYHGDHYGYNNKLKIDDKSMDLMEYMIRNSKKGGYKDYIYEINTLYLPDSKICEVAKDSYCTKKYNSLTTAANEMGVKIVILNTNSTFKFGNTTAKVLYLNTNANDFTNETGSILNNCALVTKFTNGKTTFLTAGDIEQTTEKKLLQLGIDVSADVFKLNHHGLQYKKEISNTAEFLKKVNPKYSYVQFNENSQWSYKYNAIKTSIDNLSDYSNIYNTDINGNIKFVIKNDVITPVVDKNSYKITINYIDKETNKKLSSKTYEFSYNFYGNEIKYHLYDYKKEFNGYKLDTDINEIETTGVLKENKVYNLYYSSIKPTKITLNNTKLNLKVGESKSVKITKVEPSGAKCANVIWSTNDNNIVKVANGNIEALSVGSTIVTVNCDGIIAKIDVKVNKITTTKNISLNENETKLLSPSSSVKDWKTSDNSIAIISQNGQLTAKKPGTVTITANLTNGNTDIWVITINKLEEDEAADEEVNIETPPEDDIEEEVKPDNDYQDNKNEIMDFVNNYGLIVLISLTVIFAVALIFDNKNAH